MTAVQKLIYEICMLLFAVVSVATIWIQSGSNSIINWTVWGIFFTDFSVRFFKAESKWTFIKQNPFLVIAIIPLDSIFQLARITQVIHLFRLKVITKHFTSPFIRKLKKKRLIMLIPFSFVLVFLAVIPLYYLEPGVQTYKDAFLGSIASLIFFGTSEIEPTTVWGNSIIILLTVFGVIMHGVIISFLFSIVLELEVVKSILNKSASEDKHL